MRAPASASRVSPPVTTPCSATSSARLTINSLRSMRSDISPRSIRSVIDIFELTPSHGLVTLRAVGGATIQSNSPSPLGPFPLTEVSQVGLVVRDLAVSMRHYWERFGVGPWTVYTYGPPLVKEMTYRGRRQDYRMRLG